jgi:hypothetical protein
MKQVLNNLRERSNKMRKVIVLWIARVLRVNVNSLVSRRFRHKDGFGDDTDYLEVIEATGKTILHFKDGTKDTSDSWPLERCLREVRDDRWIEIVY